VEDFFIFLNDELAFLVVFLELVLVVFYLYLIVFASVRAVLVVALLVVLEVLEADFLA